MNGQDLIDFILDNELEDYEVLIQSPFKKDVMVPLESTDIDWSIGKEETYLG